MDRVLLGLPDLRRHRRSDRLPVIARLRLKVRGVVEARVVLVGEDVTIEATASDAHFVRHGCLANVDWHGRRADAGRSRSRATTSSRSSSRPARQRSRRVSSSAIATCSRTSFPVEREILKYPEIRAALSSAPIPELCCPSAICSGSRWRPTSRRWCAATRHLHAQLQPARHPAIDQVAANLGPRVRAEDSRRLA